VWKLPEPRVAGIDEVPITILRDEQTPIQWWFAGVVRRQQRDEAVVPSGGKIKSSLLNPPFKIRLRYPIGIVHGGVVGLQNRHGGGFVGHTVARKGEVERSEPIDLQVTGCVVLDNDGSAVFDVIEEIVHTRFQVGPGVEGAHTEHDGVDL